MMNVDRLSVTVPTELGAELRRVADLRGQPVSTFVAEAISHQLRLEALNETLREDDLEFGPVSEEGIADAMKMFDRAEALAAKKHSRKAAA